MITSASRPAIFASYYVAFIITVALPLWGLSAGRILIVLSLLVLKCFPLFQWYIRYVSSVTALATSLLNSSALCFLLMFLHAISAAVIRSSMGRLCGVTPTFNPFLNRLTSPLSNCIARLMTHLSVMLSRSSRCRLSALWPTCFCFRNSWSYFRCCLSRVSRKVVSCACSMNSVSSSFSVSVSFVSNYSFSSSNLFTVKWHWDILMFNSFFSAFLRIIDAFIFFTVDFSCRLFAFGITLSWRQRVLKWRWFFQQATFIVTISSPRSVFTTSRSCCRMILECSANPVSWLFIFGIFTSQETFIFFLYNFGRISRPSSADWIYGHGAWLAGAPSRHLCSVKAFPCRC